MREEALVSLLSHFTANERLQLADMDTGMNNIVMNWSDVNSLLVDKGRLILGSKEKCVLVIQEESEDSTAGESEMKDLERVLEQFPNIERIVVQRRLNEEERQMLLKKTGLKKMYISNDNFIKESWDQFHFPNLRSLNILQRLDRSISFTPFVSPEIISGSRGLRRLCLTGVLLSWPTLKAIFALPLLQSLDLLGAAVETNQMFYLSALESPRNLEEVSLPPSLFSFSTAKVNGKCASNFKWLNAPKVCIYMHRYDKEQFWTDVGRFSSSLEVMVLHGNYSQLQACERFRQWKKFKFLFGPFSAQTMSPTWSPSECLLLSHYVRCPPYAQESLKHFGDEWQLDIQQTTEPPKELGLKKPKKKSASRRRSSRRRSWRNLSRRRRRPARDHSPEAHTARVASPEMHTAREPERVVSPRPQQPQVTVPTSETTGNLVVIERHGDQAAVGVTLTPQEIPVAQEQVIMPPPPGEPTDEEVVEALVDLIVGGVARDMERLNAAD